MSSNILSVSAVALLVGFNAVAGQLCQLTGHVTNAVTGEPVKKALLHLQPADKPGRQGYVTVSGPDGSFQFSNLEPGTYQLLGERSGFLYSTYGAKRQRWSGTLLVLKAGQEVAAVNFQLAPASVISGRVLDEDGDPVVNASIQALRRVFTRGKMSYQQQAGGNSDDRGEFRLAGLEPGKYIVSAQAGAPVMNEIRTGALANTGMMMTYYAGAINVQDATPIDVQRGQEFGGLELRVRRVPGFRIRGAIAQAREAGQLQIQLVPDGFNGVGANGAMLGQDGKFEIANVVPGSYRLLLLDNNRGMKVAGSETVRVDSADVDGIVLNAIPPGSIYGHTRVEGTPPAGSATWSPKIVHVSLSPYSEGVVFGGGGESSVNADGSFVLNDIGLGAYQVTAYDGLEETYLKSVRFNGQDVLNKPIDLWQGASGELDIVFSYGAPVVHGTVQSTDANTAAGGAFVVIAQAGSESVAAAARTDQNGSFDLKSLTPGRYRAYAFDDLSDEETGNPDLLKALESKSTEIELKQNDNKAVQLTLISGDELQQVLSKLGLEAP